MANSLCISRITDNKFAQYFADGKHKFYVEFRCNRPSEKEICEKCSVKSNDAKLQHSRMFDHGHIHDPIPDKSHIYGGKWYKEMVKKWGEPSSDILQFAVDHMNKARMIYKPVPDPIQDPDEPIAKPKKTRRKCVIASELDHEEKEKKEEKEKPEKIENPEKIEKKEENPENPDKIEKKKVKKSKKSSKYIIGDEPASPVHKEVVLPTFIEKVIELVEDCEIEYVKLTRIQVGSNEYFIDKKKNKLYENVKEKIGKYVGRLYNDSIHTEYDSDE